MSQGEYHQAQGQLQIVQNQPKPAQNQPSAAAQAWPNQAQPLAQIQLLVSQHPSVQNQLYIAPNQSQVVQNQPPSLPRRETPPPPLRHGSTPPLPPRGQQGSSHPRPQHRQDPNLEAHRQPPVERAQPRHEQIRNRPYMYNGQIQTATNVLEIEQQIAQIQRQAFNNREDPRLSQIENFEPHFAQSLPPLSQNQPQSPQTRAQIAQPESKNSQELPFIETQPNVIQEKRQGTNSNQSLKNKIDKLGIF